MHQRDGRLSISTAAPAARYADVANIYQAANFSPIPVKGKRPVPTGATGREGVVTRADIDRWIADPEWSGQNTALRADGFIGIDVDQYGEKHGAEQLAELEARLGALPATITSTSRGQGHPSRQHFYAVPEGVEFDNQPAADIEIVQRHHRYSLVWPSVHPETGATYQWYDYDGEPLAEPPHRSDFETLPDAWIQHLTVERSVYNHEQRVAEKVQSASPDEERQINAIVRDLESLPRGKWSEGDGWHDTVYTRACWLIRMSNSNDYAIREDQAENILFTFTPTYPDWGQDKIAEQWLSAKKSVGHAVADAPESTLPVPQDLLDVANLLPAGYFTSRGEMFTDLLFNDPEIKTEKSFWLRRHEILVEAMRAGLTDEQAASLAYGSTSGMLLQIESTGIAKLWREVAKAREAVDREGGKGVEAPPTEERGGLNDGRMRRLELMTDAERDEANAVQWFGSEYMDFAEESVSVLNAPYHRVNRWMVLSAVYAPHGVIPLGGGRTLPCNVYLMVVGDTTTGKSESVDLAKTVFKAFYSVDTNPMIGGNASPNALIEKLITRDGQASIFISDEAHGHIKAMRQGGWLNQLPEILTDLHGGNVPMILRNGNKDVSGIDATTYFIMHYAGTMKGLSEVLLPEDWESGFLNRFVWAIGEKHERTRDSMKIKIRRPGDKTANIDPRQMQKHWAAEFASNIRRIGSTGGPVELDIDREVEDRHNDLNWKLSTLTDGHRHEHMLKPTFIRFSITVLKLACLVAMSMGETKVTRIHHLIATEQAEEWAANILAMVERTTESGFTKKVDDLERFIASQPDRRSRLERIYNHMKLPVYDTDKFLTQLVAEGRVRKFQNPQLHNLVEIIEQQKEALAA